ncbi:MAG TPA: hypothetical protein VNT51_06795 [Miltoncostaeaceae bacterium]|jgi:hypothetical protein|nr:hypothetical protein [Miltoncostaeaceae bacterium]
MSSTTGFIFSYAIGLIFLVGGLLFMLLLEENRFLFGIPYFLMGVLIVYGMHSGRRRRIARERREAELGLDADPPGEGAR